MPAISAELEVQLQQAWTEGLSNASGGKTSWTFGFEAAKDALSRLLEKGVLEVKSESKLLEKGVLKDESKRSINKALPIKKSCKMLIIPRQPKWSNNLREIIISRRHLGTSANALEYCQEAATTWAKKNSAIFIIPDYWKSDEVKAGFLKLKEHQIKVLGLIPKERKDADVLRESLSNDSIDASICSNEKEATEHIKKFDPKIKVSTPKQNVKTSQASLSASNEHSNLTEPQIKSPKIAEALPSISNAPTIATVSETENKKDKTPPRVLRPRTTSKN